jgi:hypothetical protein
MSNLSSIVNELKKQRARLDSAIKALGGVVRREGRSDSRVLSSSHESKRKGRRGRRKMSAAVKRRISAGMKARWAKAKKAGNRRPKSSSAL